MVLISFVLVLVATGVLVLGLLRDGVALVYLSIACSVSAGLTLGVAVKLAARRAVSPVSRDDRDATPPVQDPSPDDPASPAGEGAATGGGGAEAHAEGAPPQGSP